MPTDNRHFKIVLDGGPAISFPADAQAYRVLKSRGTGVMIDPDDVDDADIEPLHLALARQDKQREFLYVQHPDDRWWRGNYPGSPEPSGLN